MKVVMHHENATRPSGPSEHRDRGAEVTSRISGESEPLMGRATESLSVMHCSVHSDEHDAEHGVRSGPGSRWRRSSATSQGRHPTNRTIRKTREVM